MPRLHNPLFSLGASGSISGALTFLKRSFGQIVEKKPEIKDAKTAAQLDWRHMFLKVVALWHDLSAAEQTEWESAARPRHMTGYAWFVSQALRPNPGIYLPLQGGTMQGDIDMDGFRIEDIPNPVMAQDPDTLAARNAAIATHAGLPIVHQNAPGLIATHKAIAAAHHARYTNAEAVTAAKTVKLDDFATPDDNADLDFGTLRHGLVPKGTDVGDFLKDNGTWATVIAGKTIATGTYTGDGTDNRQITTGFKCSMVIIIHPPFTYQWILIPGECIVHYRASPFHRVDSANTALHATDGFTVSSTGAAAYGSNRDPAVYYYWAISE